MTTPGPPNEIIFFVVACAVSMAYVKIETLASFPYQGLSLSQIALHPWALVLDFSYGLVTFLVGVVLWETGALRFSWVWSLGLGVGVPLALHTGVTLFQPISGSGKDMVAGLQGLMGRYRGFCYLRISQTIVEERVRRKKRLAGQSENELLNRLQIVCTPQEYQKIEDIYQELEKLSKDRAKNFLIAGIEKHDPQFPGLQPQTTTP